MFITCEVIEMIQSHDKVATASDHDGVEENDKNNSEIVQIERKGI